MIMAAHLWGSTQQACKDSPKFYTNDWQCNQAIVKAFANEFAKDLLKWKKS